MDDTIQVQILSGQISVLRAFAIALIASSREDDLQRFATEFKRVSDAEMALESGVHVDDAYLVGQRKTLEDLQANIAKRLGKTLPSMPPAPSLPT